jgi:hypothetical protein
LHDERAVIPIGCSSPLPIDIKCDKPSRLFDLNGAAKLAITKHSSAIMVRCVGEAD